MGLGDLAELRMVSHVSGRFVTCNFGFESRSVLSDWRESLAADWEANIVPAWYNGMSDEMQYFTTVVVDVVPGTGADVEGPSVISPTGTLDTPVASLSLACKIHWRTALAGRSFKGASFLCGYPANATISGTDWSPTVADHCLARAEAIFNRYVTLGDLLTYKLCIISRWENGVLRSPPIGTPVAAFEVTNSIHCQRRRLPN